LTWQLVALCLVLPHCAAALAQEESSSAGPNKLAIEPRPQESSPELSSPPPPASARTETQSPFSPLIAEPADLGLAPDRFNAGESVRKMLVALLVVIAVMCIVVFVLKRLMGSTPVLLDQRLGRVIGRIYLTPKAVLYLVNVGGKVLLIGTTPTSINLIAEVTGDDILPEMERARPESISPRMIPFATHIAQFISKFSGPQRTGDEEAKLEEYLRDIKGQMAKLSALIGGSEDEEQG